MKYILCAVLGMSAVASVSGCATPSIDSDSFQHILSVNKDGGINKRNIKIQESNYARENVKIREGKIENIVSGLKAHDLGTADETHVVIYIHGGLNSELKALKRVAAKHDHIKDAYPIFVNWNTSFSSTYANHIFRIRQGEVSNTAPITAPLYFATDIATTAINTPKSWIVSGVHSFKTGLYKKRKDIDQNLAEESAKYGFINFTGNGLITNTLLGRTKWVLTSPAKVVTTPFVYSLAKPAWDVMLRRSNTALYRLSEDIADQNYAELASSVNGVGALVHLLKSIEEYEPNSREKKLKISLIGHSMGAIIVNKVLTYDLNLEIANIVHLGSADTVESVFTKVIPYLKKYPSSKFYSLHLHPSNEDRESNFAGLVPSGSLLVWIDEMYTSPDSIMTRRAGRWDNISGVVDRFPNELKLMERMHFKIYGIDKDGSTRDENGFLTTPQKHGDFGDLRFWEEETWKR